MKAKYIILKSSTAQMIKVKKLLNREVSLCSSADKIHAEDELFQYAPEMGRVKKKNST